MAGAMAIASAQPGQIITDGLQLRLEPQLTATQVKQNFNAMRGVYGV